MSRTTNDKLIVAVLGSGRSGTHMLGYLIDTSKQVTASIEDRELFPLITRAATQGCDAALSATIRDTLARRLDECPTRFYLEKSHPLLWLAGFPEIGELPIVFVGIQRDPYAVVASMLEHNGTRRWVEEWSKLPQPNLFLGTNRANVDEYARMTLAERCAMRWISHTRELERLAYVFGPDRYLLLRYEDLVLQPRAGIRAIEQLTGMKGIDTGFEMRRDSLTKWQQQLSAEQVRLVGDVLTRHYGALS